MALANELNTELCHFDVKQASIQADLDYSTYACAFPKGEEKCQGQFVKLDKAVYGLRQAGRQWNI